MVLSTLQKGSNLGYCIIFLLGHSILIRQTFALCPYCGFCLKSYLTIENLLDIIRKYVDDISMAKINLKR